jgi:hypothetical protein
MLVFTVYNSIKKQIFLAGNKTFLLIKQLYKVISFNDLR